MSNTLTFLAVWLVLASIPVVICYCASKVSGTGSDDHS